MSEVSRAGAAAAAPESGLLGWHRELDTKERRMLKPCVCGWALDARDAQQLYAFVIPALISVWGITRGEAGAVEVREEVGDDEGQVVESEAGGAAERADHGALLFGGLPGQPARPRGAVEAVPRAALAPFAHRLGADAVAPGQNAAGLARAGDLGADGGGGAGIGVDPRHRSPPSRSDAGHGLEAALPV